MNTCYAFCALSHTCIEALVKSVVLLPRVPVKEELRTTTAVKRLLVFPMIADVLLQFHLCIE